MTQFESLIQHHCPNGVKWVKLGGYIEIYTGVQYNKENMLKSGSYPVINGGINPSGYIEQNNEQAETITISQGGASAGYVNYMITPFWAGAHCFVVRAKNESTLCKRYLYHFLKNKQYELQTSQQGAGIPSVNRDKVKELEIPLPPLPIQKKIVEILDKFSTLSAELEAELEKRKKQYEYYRTRLLSFDSDSDTVVWKTIGDLFEFKNGVNASKEQFGHGTPIVNYVNVYKKNCIHLNDLKGLVELDDKVRLRYDIKRGDVFFTRTSETQEEIGYASVLLEDIPNGVFSGFLLRARPKTNILLPEYCKYCFASYDMRKAIIRSSTMTTRALTNGTTLSALSIPIPSLAEQERIVAILDKFEALVTDLSQGLPAEIQKVQQQYEYYRNLLLNFEK